MISSFTGAFLIIFIINSILLCKTLTVDTNMGAAKNVGNVYLYRNYEIYFKL